MNDNNLFHALLALVSPGVFLSAAAAALVHELDARIAAALAKQRHPESPEFRELVQVLRSVEQTSGADAKAVKPSCPSDAPTETGAKPMATRTDAERIVMNELYRSDITNDQALEVLRMHVRVAVAAERQRCEKDLYDRGFTSIAQSETDVKAAVAAEREACAKICRGIDCHRAADEILARK